MISFHDHDMAAAKLPEDQFRKSTLVIKVDDERDESANGFSRKNGEDIARLVLDAIAKDYDIVAHCNAGVSRSRGAGLAAAMILNQDQKPYFQHGNPNPLVVHHILAAARGMGANHASWPKMLRKVIVCPTHPHDLLVPGRDVNGLCGTCPICTYTQSADAGDTLHVWGGSFANLI